MNGTVSNIIPAKKYGFISGDDGTEYFFHMEEITSNWHELIGDFTMYGAGKIKVNFRPVRTAKGPRAVDVVIVE